MSHVERMTIALPAEMAAVIKSAVECGDYASSSEVFRDAIRDWKYKRHMQLQDVEAIRAGVADGLAQSASGQVKPASEVFSRLEDKYKMML